MNAIDELGSLRSNNDIPTKTSSDSLRLNIGGNKINNNFNNINNNINNNEINNININNNFNTNNNTNITTITSLEDKLNGLTLKLSKLNESINNNKKKLSAYSNMDQFPMYNNTNDLNQDLNEKEGNSPFINIGLGNTVLGNLNNINELENNNIKLNNGINKNIGLKHIEFNNKFQVYSNNEVEAFYILTPNMIGKIKEIERELKGGLLLVFNNNQLHIGIKNNKQTFTPSLFINVHKFVDSCYRDIKTVMKLVDLLELDNDLFKVDTTISSN